MNTLFLALALAVPAAPQIHVDSTATSGGDGQSWATAFQSVDEALAIASAGQRVWVAAGVYQPTVERVLGEPRTRTFAPAPGVRMYGGFAGFETSLADRVGLIRQTVLDGDIGAPGYMPDNVYNVVRLEGNGAIHIVDGFTIRGGYADGTGLARGGAGIASQLGTKTIRNCLFEGHTGIAGGALLSQISVTRIERCTFRNNVALQRGGAMYATSSFSVTDSLFYENKSRTRGGAVHATQGGDDIEQVPVTRFQNCVFRDNTANEGGAAFVGDPSGPVAAGHVVWSGCTFFANTALTAGGAIGTNPTRSFSLHVDLQNSILWGNRSGVGDTLGGDPGHFRKVEYCIVEGGWAGAGNMDTAPYFRNVTRRDLRLRPGSPAIDAGCNECILRDRNDLDRDDDFFERVPFDCDGQRRRVDDQRTPDIGQGTGPIVDIGAYEY